MKRFFVIAAALLALFALAACDIGAGMRGRGVQGTGAMVERDFDISNFNRLELRGGFYVVFNYSDTYSVLVSMQENLFEHLEVSVANGSLLVETTETIRTTAGNTPVVYIQAPHLSYLAFFGAVSTRDWDNLEADSLTISSAGAASINLSLDVGLLFVSVEGAASLELSGYADLAEVSAAGAVDFDAFELVVRDMRLQAAGASNANVHVTEYLNVEIDGVGVVNFRGNPTITRSISGLGSINDTN